MVVFPHQPDCLVSQSVGWFGQSVCLGLYIGWVTQFGFASCNYCWAKAPIKIARMTLTIKLDGNWSSFQLANCAPPLGVTDSAIAPSARMLSVLQGPKSKQRKKRGTCLSSPFGSLTLIPPLSTRQHQATPGTTRQHH